MDTTVMDETNELLHREYVPSELKIVNIDESEIDEQVYEIEKVLDHRVLEGGKKEYLVKWVGYDDSWNFWLTPEHFSSPFTLNEYWERVNSKELPKSHSTTSRKEQKSSRKVSGNFALIQSKAQRDLYGFFNQATSEVRVSPTAIVVDTTPQWSSWRNKDRKDVVGTRPTFKGIETLNGLA
ncbi:hypothetical protein EDC96DRAFT_612228 [Choanephora cucurbitarum]|nr:hypothetical protein EDC96DRAFT_612228 [Choanephora cucurbitarum]